MDQQKLKYLYIIGGVLTALLASASLYLLKKPDNLNYEVGASDNSSPPWLWENPYTYRKISIPGDWQVARSQELKETTLALSHRTGKSLVYIIYEAAVNPMSLHEYVEAMNAANEKELGTGEFAVNRSESGQDIYQAGGARNFDDNLVVTNVRIWSNDENYFWRSVSITDIEYREIEYDAEKIMDLLYESTRQEL